MVSELPQQELQFLSGSQKLPEVVRMLVVSLIETSSAEVNGIGLNRL